mmetsp:Transcript_20704/g.57826  ORF Transcript_20704/g.57826 Transcript_20704/m.57826 type:complete len:211 (-) Transcript_20704:483-1115(-)
MLVVTQFNAIPATRRAPRISRFSTGSSEPCGSNHKKTPPLRAMMRRTIPRAATGSGMSWMQSYEITSSNVGAPSWHKSSSVTWRKRTLATPRRCCCRFASATLSASGSMPKKLHAGNAAARRNVLSPCPQPTSSTLADPEPSTRRDSQMASTHRGNRSRCVAAFIRAMPSRASKPICSQLTPPPSKLRKPSRMIAGVACADAASNCAVPH